MNFFHLITFKKYKFFLIYITFVFVVNKSLNIIMSHFLIQATFPQQASNKQQASNNE
tara:strand:- start:189 stop:359 length:171 start_codon:yes stop_codon:yes gene_type:complete